MPATYRKAPLPQARRFRPRDAKQADPTVPCKYSVALLEKLRATCNDSELVTLPNGAHNLNTPEQRATIAARSKAFLERLKLLP